MAPSQWPPASNYMKHAPADNRICIFLEKQCHWGSISQRSILGSTHKLTVRAFADLKITKPRNSPHLSTCIMYYMQMIAPTRCGSQLDRRLCGRRRAWRHALSKSLYARAAAQNNTLENISRPSSACVYLKVGGRRGGRGRVGGWARTARRSGSGLCAAAAAVGAMSFTSRIKLSNTKTVGGDRIDRALKNGEDVAILYDVLQPQNSAKNFHCARDDTCLYGNADFIEPGRETHRVAKSWMKFG